MTRLLLSLLLLCAACNVHDRDHSKTTNGVAKVEPDPGEELVAPAAAKLVGTQAPDLSVKTIDGETIRLRDTYGKKAVYLEFWATWCVPCRQQMPHFESVAKSAGGDLAVIGINTGFNDTLQSVNEYRHELGLTMPLTIDDGRLASAFDLRATPQHIVIGKDGRIAFVGHLADNRVDEAIKHARRGDPSPLHNASGPSQPVSAIQVLNEKIQTIDGKQVKLRPSEGGKVVLLFFSPWCESYLKESRPEASRACRVARQAAAAALAQGDKSWVGIASRLWATPKDLQDYANKYHLQMPLVFDASGELFRAFDVNHVPTMVVVDASGRIVRRVEGVGRSAGATS